MTKSRSRHAGKSWVLFLCCLWWEVVKIIEISFDVNPEGTFWGFSARGHAGYAARGSDIVCAAVSALTQGAAHTLEGMKDTGTKVYQGTGELHCTICHPCITTQAIMAMLKLSLKELENQYRNHLRIAP
ncbi:ribosomal-processing cysteine protease Prp [Lacrimispora sp. 210928-DFI.3.58]|uniref:ribosomal-processing cysteine protease Prp n=1 Tax=Lacrimispora sp. 210928-DFI.3.58 TaxID=2883214 RepID=UPI001D06A545|nr:ribosomal-processing cysteine protease Prp [Lacrimispora sp. 210928-DFI.3.58]MCB7321096.1 ribosomal-processing cysteine protease Prp [Lacrimispora sp. 210928-DFI.3.58]